MVTALLAGCAQNNAPVVDKPVYDGASRESTAGRGASAAPASGDWRPETYTVKRGDTLYSIALEHGHGYRDVAAWNQIPDPNLIQVGQQLRVRPPPGWVEPAEEPEPAVVQAVAPPAEPQGEPLQAPAPIPLKSAPKALKAAYSEQALAQLTGVPAKPVAAPPAAAKPPGSTKPAAVAKAAPAAGTSASRAPAAKPAPAPGGAAGRGWIWPAQGPLLHAFNQGSNPKGIAIAGDAGQPVVAAAAGKVVYSGSGLRGYGKLIIIKHDETYLSVYAHNRALLVKEGERVSGGQRIAEMGSTDAERVALHFEIRRLGKPIDPLQLLPASGA